MHNLIELLESKADVSGTITIHRDYLQAYKDLTKAEQVVEDPERDSGNAMIVWLKDFNQKLLGRHPSDLSYGDRKIPAIKDLRLKTHCGLKEAKEYCDVIWEARHA